MRTERRWKALGSRLRAAGAPPQGHCFFNLHMIKKHWHPHDKTALIFYRVQD